MTAKFFKILGLVAILALSPVCNATKVLVYNGPGAGPTCVANTVALLKQLLSPDYNVETVGPQTLKQEQGLQDTALLVMPGGEDLPYVRDLAGTANINIRRFVENGGRYLGICAGAYYAADAIDFGRGTDFVVKGERELKFYPKLVVGPAYSGFDPLNPDKSGGMRAARIQWGSSVVPLFYNGGGYFDGAESIENLDILAYYLPETANDPIRAAVVATKVGQGTVVLSGPHFEWSGAELDEGDATQATIQATLLQNNNKRLEFAGFLLHKLGLQLHNAVNYH